MAKVDLSAAAAFPQYDSNVTGDHATVATFSGYSERYASEAEAGEVFTAGFANWLANLPKGAALVWVKRPATRQEYSAEIGALVYDVSCLVHATLDGAATSGAIVGVGSNAQTDAGEANKRKPDKADGSAGGDSGETSDATKPLDPAAPSTASASGTDAGSAEAGGGAGE